MTTIDTPILVKRPAAVARQPEFGALGLGELLATRREGYAWTRGIHLYSELRPVQALEVAEREDAARKFLQIIEDYTHAGIQAAELFGIELLEVQGTVLHFHLEDELNHDAFKKAISFAYIFTKVLYETLASEMGDEWKGFAVCMDHGPAVIVSHGHTSNSSVISLSEAANKPAKRLLYGKTEAGHAEFPEAWRTGKQSEAWVPVNLRDREGAPSLRDYENAPIEAKFR